ncbi:hypothetical protein [Paraburkholderia sp.]|uniref:hypothetical protein n=1 Tax=Paraburkholderia sp. TaxID=1926495 RepID=UPI002AFECB4F|nr:hypothetical protein [Paraburkholderia sp.]
MKATNESSEATDEYPLRGFACAQTRDSQSDLPHLKNKTPRSEERGVGRQSEFLSCLLAPLSIPLSMSRCA